MLRRKGIGMRKKRRLLELGDGFPPWLWFRAHPRRDSRPLTHYLTSSRLNPATLVTPTVGRLGAKLTHDHQQAIGSERYGDPARRHERSL